MISAFGVWRRPVLGQFKLVFCTFLGLLFLISAALPAAEAELSFEARVEARRAIEEVYWRHRIWPRTDVAKPGLTEVLPDDVLERQVEDSLRLSTALADRWHRPITTNDLQAEIDRMVGNSSATEVLDELFAALGNDPQLIAECLARPLLAQRLARDAYADDNELHAAAKARAQSAVERIHTLGNLQQVDGDYGELEWVKWGDEVAKHGRMNEEGAKNRLLLDPAEWAELTDRLDSGIMGSGPGMIGPLREERHRFVVSTLVERTPDRIKVASVSWAKENYNDWWARTREDHPPTHPGNMKDIKLGVVTQRDISPDHWVSVGTAGSPPSARTRHTVVWTGSEMIIWGGTMGELVYYSGSTYDPATDSWTVMSTTNRPDARADHTAVWDGSRMIVWGGWNGNLLASGGAYQPGSNSWSSVTSTNAPSGRRYHTAVADSDGDMIVWGGWDGSSYLGGACAIYDPGSDDWSSGTATNAPSPRSDHAAAYVPANDKMVVWGGQNAAGVLGTGATYNPTVNNWSTMPSEGALSARMGHSATAFPAAQSYDRGVFFWGGSNGSATQVSGSFFKLQSNTWNSSSFNNVPAGRQGHTAVGTGLTAIIWGGFSGSVLRNTGGVYNVYNNVWMATSTTGAPSARKGHTAVWREQTLASTNGEMVVWGGDDGSPTNTGGRYSEPTDFLVKASIPGRTVVPGGIESNIIRAFVYSLGDFSSPVSLSCSMGTLGCDFDTNPANPLPNSSFYTDVDMSPWPSLNVGDYEFDIIGSSGGTTRRYPFRVVVRDFDLGCADSSVTVAPGATVLTTCNVSSEFGFNDPVDLASTNFACTFSANPVTPPTDGIISSTVSFTAPSTPGSYLEELVAISHSAYRVFELTVEVVEDELIFEDGFEEGNTWAWD